MIIFDLDDTLYKEREWAWQGYDAVAEKLRHPEFAAVMRSALAEGRNPFDALIAVAQKEIPDIKERIPELLEIYRYNVPDLHLDPSVESVLAALCEKHRLGIITDGRSRTQRLKIKSLGLLRFIDEDAIIISEEIGLGMDCKRGKEGFREMMRRFPDEREWVYVGDNPKKDFVMMGEEGWHTVMLTDEKGENIHPQTEISDVDLKIKDFAELITYCKGFIL